jgi:hypothetical protein
VSIRFAILRELVFIDRATAVQPGIVAIEPDYPVWMAAAAPFVSRADVEDTIIGKFV